MRSKLDMVGFIWPYRLPWFQWI